jgi:hypothetical protein
MGNASIPTLDVKENGGVRSAANSGNMAKVCHTVAKPFDYAKHTVQGQDLMAFAERGTGEKVTSLGHSCRMVLV